MIPKKFHNPDTRNAALAAACALLSIALPLRAAPTIAIGTPTVEAGDPAATVTLTGSISSAADTFAGLSLRAQVVSPASASPLPAFVGADFAPTVFSALSRTVTGGPVAESPDFLESGVFLNAPNASVPVNGPVAHLRLNTLGLAPGTYTIKLVNTDIGVDTAFIKPGGDEVVPNITGGTINVVASANTFWNVDADGDWPTAANWTAGSPNGAGAGARFTLPLTAPRTVTLTAPRTVGSLRFHPGASSRYTIAGSTLTLQRSSGAADLAVASGTQEIASALNLASPTSVSVAAGATLKLSGDVTGSFSGFSIGAGGTLDLTTRSIRFAHAPGDLTTAAAVRGLIAQALDRGRWDAPGLTSSAAASDPARATAVGYRDLGAEVLVRYTAYGDANLDGVVNQADVTLAATGNGTTWAGGDFNYDGKRTSDDWALLALGASLHGPGAPPIPEPAAWTLATLGTLALCACPRRSRLGS